MSPNVYIIAGPNGAGKTTFAQTFLPKFTTCAHFINGDIIAQRLSPSHPDKAAIQAGRLMLEEIRSCEMEKVEFAFESTLSGLTHLRTIARLKRAGYTIHIIYLWLPKVELSLTRVKGRVLRGGHGIPEAVLRRRFSRSITNFRTHFASLADSWQLFDNSFSDPLLVAVFMSRKLAIIDTGRYSEWQGSRGNE
jgi:predicted ABC-type ATPase